MNAHPGKKIVKGIKVNFDECIGCRSCEVVCSAYHAKPKYSSVNPSRSRIKVVKDPINDQYVPIRAAGYTKAECADRNVYVIFGKEYSECSFCGASCPSRDIFREPDSGFPLKCDMCKDNPSGPVCVQVCGTKALAYVEYEIEAM